MRVHAEPFVAILPLQTLYVYLAQPSTYENRRDRLCRKPHRGLAYFCAGTIAAMVPFSVAGFSSELARPHVRENERILSTLLAHHQMKGLLRIAVQFNKGSISAATGASWAGGRFCEITLAYF